MAALSRIIKEAKREAEKLLDVAWAGRGLPINPYFIADKLGIRVREGPLGDVLSGALIKVPDVAPEILVDTEDPPARRRFTCAHELGHFAQRKMDEAYRFLDGDADVYVFGRPKDTDSFSEEEAFANAFAANLLMPEDQVRKVYNWAQQSVFDGEPPPLWYMAEKFGVSTEAMKWRLVNLGLREQEEAAPA